MPVRLVCLESCVRLGRFAQSLAVYADFRMLVCVALGFASGLPLKLMLGSLTHWMAETGVDIRTIGLFGSVAAPYSFKFLWAPLLDRLPIPVLSRTLGLRRSWMLLTQLLLIPAIAALGLTTPLTAALPVAMIALVVTTLSATQDIALDAWRVETFSREEQGAAAASTVFGYRMGVLWGAAGMLRIVTAVENRPWLSLWRHDWHGEQAYPWAVMLDPWNITWPIMALSLVVGIAATLMAGRGHAPTDAQKSDAPYADSQAGAVPVSGDGGLRDHRPANGGRLRNMLEIVVAPARGLMQLPNWGWILAFVFLYKLTDVLAGMLTTPYLLDVGYTRLQLANVRDVLGLIAALVGAVLGGTLVRWLGVRTALVVGAVIMVVSNLGFAALEWTGPSVPALMVVISFENLAGSAAASAFVAYLSGLCDPRYAAAQYAWLTSIAALARTVFGSSTGYMQAALGWPVFFLVTAAAGLPTFALLWVMERRKAVKVSLVKE
jgi:MFS transporter, PAT family, beta-lactamase induction signal transducer AmpG